MRKKKIKSLLNSKIECISVNSLDMKLRILVDGRWFAEDKDPWLIFGSGYIHNL